MGSASSGKDSTFSLYMTFRNNSGVLVKNLPLKLLIRIFPKVVRSDIDTIIELRRLNKKSAAYAVIKGRVTGVLRIPLFLPKRWKILHNHQAEEEYIWELMENGY
jgi:hypothetical protein